ncbi:hypothetical protein ANRL1_02968 [Anaerolineae bacterium]|nr:hypothetical protein ANRL1_02968 [Anaerolineae bacterium]
MNGHLFRATRFATWVALLALLFVLAAAGNPPGVSAAMSAPVFAPNIPAADLVNTDGTLNLATGFNGTLDLRGWDVKLDAKRGPIFSRESKTGNDLPPAAPPQRPQGVPGTWSPLPFKGLNALSAVRSIVQGPNPSSVGGNGIYVGGDFTGSGDSPPTFGTLGMIARYYNGTWWPLPHNGLGPGNGVKAIAVLGSYLYVGGDFTGTADGDPLYLNNLHNIARYDSVTDTWQPLPDAGLNSTVWALAVSGSNLYVGGAFTQSATGAYTNLNGIAKYDGGATWTALPHNGLNGTVYALAVNGSNLYVGGSFSATKDNGVANLNNIAKYDGSAWSALANNGVSGSVFALAFSGANLYVGGAFSTALNPSVTLNRIAMYDGAWHVLNDAGAIGLDGNVYAITTSGTDVYVGGYFNHPNGGAKNIYYIARWDGSAWNSLPNSGLNNYVYAVLVSGSATLYDLYVGGSFDKSYDLAVNDLNRIASLANSCTATTGNWSAGGTWGACGAAPAGSDQVSIPNGQTVTLDVDAVVDGPITLNGTIDATSHILTLGAGAIVSGAGEIIGTVRRNTPGNTTRTYHTANTQITLTGSSLSSLDVVLTKGNPGQLTNYVARKYTITSGSGSFTSATMRLPYQVSEFKGITNEANLKLWRNNGTRWVLQGGTADAVNHWVDLSGVIQFSPWTISDNGAGSPTAVTLSKFDANADGGSNIVTVVGAALACVAIAGVWVARTRRS